jgi:hypothetical protein
VPAAAPQDKEEASQFTSFPAVPAGGRGGAAFAHDDQQDYEYEEAEDTPIAAAAPPSRGRLQVTPVRGTLDQQVRGDR